MHPFQESTLEQQEDGYIALSQLPVALGTERGMAERCHCSDNALSKGCAKYLHFFWRSTKYLHFCYSSQIQLVSLKTAWLNSVQAYLQWLLLQPPYNQDKIVLLFHIFFFLTSHSSIVLAFNTCSKPAIAAWSAFVVHLQGMTFLFSRHKSPDGNEIFHSWVAFNTQAEWKNLALLLKLLSVNNYLS